MIAILIGFVIGLITYDWLLLRFNTLFGQRVLKNAHTLRNYSLDKYKMYYEDIRLSRIK